MAFTGNGANLMEPPVRIELTTFRRDRTGNLPLESPKIGGDKTGL